MTALLAVRGVSRHFGGVRALDGVDLVLQGPEVHALIGPNGAGKTTLVNVLTGLLRPSSGTIALRGQPIAGLPPHRIAAAGIARTYQNGRLFPRLSVTENVMVGGQHRLPAALLSGLVPWPGARTSETALRDDATRLLHRLGLSGLADQPVGVLPYGRRRLVEIARALAGNPAVLVLDEPAAGLNSREADGLVDILAALKAEGLATILIEHNMGLVMQVADRITVLNFGRRIAEGTPADIRQDPHVLEAYLGQGYAHA